MKADQSNGETRGVAGGEGLYFAYGSNLHPLRLEQRVGPAALVSTGVLRAAAFRWHKVGRDGSGKGSVVARERESVFGAVYRLTGAQVEALDRVESIGAGYARRLTEVRLETGGVRECFTYVAMPGFVDDRLAPFDWYAELVVRGARYHGFPDDYLAALERHPTTRDPDERRAARWRRLIERLRGEGV